MKTVKFKELPEKVQGFVNRMIGKVFDPNDNIHLNWLHSIVNWSKATDEERLAYAEWRYKFGVRLKDAYDDEEYDLKLRDTIFYLEKDPRSPHDIILTRHEHHTDITIYDSDKNKWAEIIEEPEKEDVEMNASIKRDVEQVLAEDSEPTFKAGEYVEGRMKNWQEDVWTGEKLIYTGAKTKSGLFICEYPDGEVACFIAIKKTDHDKAYRAIADDILSRKSYEFATIKEFSLKRNELLNLLIEALKKGKEL